LSWATRCLKVQSRTGSRKPGGSLDSTARTSTTEHIPTSEIEQKADDGRTYDSSRGNPRST
jgi:hypothetical protein